MTLAKLAYLTSPAPNVFILNLQIDDVDWRIEISQRHLANILVDGCALALRDSSIHRVPNTQTESGNVRTEHRP